MVRSLYSMGVGAAGALRVPTGFCAFDDMGDKDSRTANIGVSAIGFKSFFIFNGLCECKGLYSDDYIDGDVIGIARDCFELLEVETEAY